MYYYFACSKCASCNIEKICNWIICKECGHKGDLQESTYVEHN